jgi:hypothetical protein
MTLSILSCFSRQKIPSLFSFDPHTVYKFQKSAIWSPHSRSVVDAMLSIIKLALRLEWPAVTRLIDTKTIRFTFITRNDEDGPFLQHLSK